MRINAVWLLFLAATIVVSAESPIKADIPQWISDGTVLTEYQAGLTKQLVAKIAQERAIPRQRPAFGILVSSVDEKSQASAAGIIPGDLLTHLDGVQLPDAMSFIRGRKKKPQQLTFWSATAGNLVIQIKRGRIGTFLEESWSPLHGYLAAPADNQPPWEDDLMLAAIAIADVRLSEHIQYLPEGQDVRLAEHALLRAQDKGCKHPTWMAVAAAIAVQLGRMPEATIYARAALDGVTELERIPVARLLYQSLLSRGLVGEAQEVAQKYDVIGSNEDRAKLLMQLADSAEPIRAARAVHSVIPLADMIRTPANKVDHARAMTYLSGPQRAIAEALPHLDPDGDLVLRGEERTKQLNNEGKLQFTAQPGRLDMTQMGPVMRDLDFAVNCQCTEDRARYPDANTAPLGTSFIRMGQGIYAICIYDHSQPGGSSERLRITVTEDSNLRVHVAGIPEYEIYRRRVNVYQEHRLQVHIREHTLGILVDDIPVYHGPFLGDPTQRQLGLVLHTRSLLGTWSKLSWCGVLAPQELPPIPAKVKSPNAPPPATGANDF